MFVVINDISYNKLEFTAYRLLATKEHPLGIEIHYAGGTKLVKDFETESERTDFIGQLGDTYVSINSINYNALYFTAYYIENVIMPDPSYNVVMHYGGYSGGATRLIKKFSTESERDQFVEQLNQISSGGGLIQVDSYSELPGIGNPGSLYITKDTGQTYYWDGNTSTYVATGTAGRTGIYSTIEELPTTIGEEVTLLKADLVVVVEPTSEYSVGSEIIGPSSVHAIISSSSETEVTAVVTEIQQSTEIRFVDTITNTNQPYLYKGVSYKKPDWNLINAFIEDKFIVGGCTGGVRDGQVYRSFDFLYNETASFIIDNYASGYKGMAGAIPSITKELVDNREDNEWFDYLPFVMLDGMNLNGIHVSTYILHREGDRTDQGSSKQRICAKVLATYLLCNLKNISSLSNVLSNICVYMPDVAPYNAEYHWLISNGNTTLCLEYINNEAVITNISNNPYIANFYLSNYVEGDLSTTNAHAQGIERREILKNGGDLSDIAYTHTYSLVGTDNVWRSDFNDVWSETIDITTSTPDDDPDLISVENTAKSAWESRTRGDGTWHTQHACIYDFATRSFKVCTQEDYETWYPEVIGGGADAKLTKDIQSNVTVGAINSGDTLLENTTFTEFVEKLLIKEVAPTITFTSTDAGILEIGSTVSTPTLKLQINSLGTATPTSIDFYIGNTKVDTQNYVSGTNTYTYVSDTDITANETTKAVLNYTKSDGTSSSISATKTYTFVYASYYGAVSSISPSSADIKALSKSIKNVKGFTYNNITLGDERVCYAYPKIYGNLSSIKDANNFEYQGSYTSSELTIDGITYLVYVLTDPITVTGFKQIYA